MERRRFLAILAGTAISPRAALARETPVRIGFLAGSAAASINSAAEIRAIKQGLESNGLVDGRDYIFEPRFAAGNDDHFPDLARDLIQSGVNIVLVNTPAAQLALRRLAREMPIVAVAMDDIPHDGATTGIALGTEELARRLFESQRAIIPGRTSIAILFNPSNPPGSGFPDNIRKRAQAAGFSVTLVGFQSRNELEAAFASFSRKPPDAVHILLESGTSDFIDRIPALALMHHLPTFANRPEFAIFGGLLGYGTAREPLYVRSGAIVKQILDGAKPGDLPVEPSPSSQLWLNKTTAEALALALPPSLLAIADKIIG